MLTNFFANWILLWRKQHERRWLCFRKMTMSEREVYRFYRQKTFKKLKEHVWEVRLSFECCPSVFWVLLKIQDEITVQLTWRDFYHLIISGSHAGECRPVGFSLSSLMSWTMTVGSLSCVLDDIELILCSQTKTTPWRSQSLKVSVWNLGYSHWV